MTATGFDFEPLPTGDVLIQFVVVHAFFLTVEKGKEAALAFLDSVMAAEGDRHAE